MSDKTEGKGYLLAATDSEDIKAGRTYYLITGAGHYEFVEKADDATVLPNLEVALWEARQFECPDCRSLTVRIIPADKDGYQFRHEAMGEWYNSDQELPELPELGEEEIRELQGCLAYIYDVSPSAHWKKMVEEGYGPTITIEGDDGAGMLWHIDRMMKLLGVDENNSFMFERVY